VTRALLFDLDDTLYPERQFIRSGFRAVAADVEARFGLRRRDALAVLLGALRRGSRHGALQDLCARYRLPLDLVPALVDVIRAHTPALRLPASSRDALIDARARGWRLGIVTNGFPALQARKALALDLPRLVDAVVYANEWGTGAGKPERAVFDVALAKLGARAPHAVFVGDDPRCDIFGARQAGLFTIRMLRVPGLHGRADACAPDRTVTDLGDALTAAGELIATEVADAA